MATRSNRFYNNPQFAQIASNISSMFAPPSAGDELAYAKANAERQQAARMQDLWKSAGDDFDRMGVAAGQWNPNQSYYSVDQANTTAQRGQDISAATSRSNNALDNETTRRGQDITAQTSTTNNLQDNRFGLMSDLATTTVGEGERAPGSSILDDEIAAAAGITPGMAIEGREAPLSSDEMEAIAMQEIMAENPSYAGALAYNDIESSNIVDPTTGDIRMAPTGESAMLGLEPYLNPGSQASGKMVSWYDPQTDTQGTAIFDPNTNQVSPMNGGGEIPATAQFSELAEPTGTNEQLGIGKPGQNVIDQEIMSIDSTVQTLDELSGLISESPSSQGAVGAIRGTMQDLVQTGNELGQYLGGEVEQINEQIRSGAVPEDVAANFDPSLPAISVLSNVLAFKYAKTLNEDRLSNEMLQQARRALGLDRMTSNQADSLSRLTTVRDTLMAQREDLLAKKGGGLNAGAPPAQGPQTGPAIGTVEDGFEFTGGDPSDQNNWRQVQ